MTREERELSITYLEGIKEEYIEGYGYERHPLPEYYAIETAIKALEPEPHWIPCSERLPEVGSEVLVCYEFKGKKSVYIADFYGDGDFHGLDDEYLTSECRKYRKAVAWMPLPEPYIPERSDKE